MGCLPGGPRLSNVKGQHRTGEEGRETRAQIRAASVPEAVCGVGLAAPIPNSPRETALYDSLRLPRLELHNPHSEISARKTLIITQSLFFKPFRAK